MWTEGERHERKCLRRELNGAMVLGRGTVEGHSQVGAGREKPREYIPLTLPHPPLSWCLSFAEPN